VQNPYFNLKLLINVGLTMYKEPLKCSKCGSDTELKWNGGDPRYVCVKDECRKIQEPTVQTQFRSDSDDELTIPVNQIEQVSPGVFRVKPSDALREWARRQGKIKIV
jgi:hypothetical protein